MKFRFNKKTLTLFSLIVILSFSSKLVFAVWNGTFYEPGDTLNPECLPTDVDCDVRAPLTSTSISDTIYGAGWDADTTHAPSKNAVYDKIEGLVAGSHDAVTIGTANGLSLATQVLSLALASTNTTGALSDTDWNTFNNKANTALSNLASVAINTSLISDTTNTDDLGSATVGWKNGYFVGNVNAARFVGAGGTFTGSTFINSNNGILYFGSSSNVGLKYSAAGILELNNGNAGVLATLNAATVNLSTSLVVGDDAAETVTLSRSSADRYFLFNAIGTAAGDAFRIHNFSHPTGSTAIPDGYNIFMGAGAGNFTVGSTASNPIFASRNIGIGTNALTSLTLGYNNTIIGDLAGDAITTGNSNVAIGYSALSTQTSPAENTGVGTFAGIVINGTGNTLLGYSAAVSSTSATSLTAVGHSALAGNTTGDDNTAIGHYAGRYLADGSTGNATGSQNTYLGQATKSSAAGQTNEIVIGYNAIGNGSNTVTLGNTSITDTILQGEVGIGTALPSTKLHIDKTVQDTTPILKLTGVGNFTGSPTDSVDGVGIGLVYNASGNRQFWIGDSANGNGFRIKGYALTGWNYVSGTAATSITIGQAGQGVIVPTSVTTPLVLGGTSTTQDLTFQTTSGIGATGADMHFLVGNNGATEAMTILNDGKVGIGTVAPISSLTIKDAGIVLMNFEDGSGNTGWRFENHNQFGVVNATIGYIEAGNTGATHLVVRPRTGTPYTHTSGTKELFMITGGFAPTSGTAIFNNTTIDPTINQTGGANGITRGIYINPTLTAAADFRALEIANNSGYAIYQSGASALNYFAGNVNLGSSLVVGDDAAETVTLSRSSADRYFLFNAIGTAAGDAFRIHNFSHPTGSTAVPAGNNIFIGNNSGNFTMGSTATSTAHASTNIGIGKNTLSALTTGGSNIIIGDSSGAQITTGTAHTIIGSSAGAGISTSSGVTAIGAGAAQTMTASNVTAVGRNAAVSSSSATGTTAIGYASLQNNTTGDNNTALGDQAGAFLSDGSTANATPSNATYLGAVTKSSAAGQTNEIVIGYNTIGNGSNTATIGNTSLTNLFIGGTTNTADLGSALNVVKSGYFGTSVISPLYDRPEPTATTGASQAGLPISITASDAVASTDTDGAAAGGSITITAGNAARLTSGNANGGNVVLVGGTGIGTGTAGQVLIPSGVAGAPGLAFSSAATTGFYINGGQIFAGTGGSGRVAIWSGGFYPATNNNLDLGTSSNLWRTGYFGTSVGINTATIPAKLTVNGTLGGASGSTIAIISNTPTAGTETVLLSLANQAASTIGNQASIGFHLAEGQGITAKISAVRETTAPVDGLAFYTYSGGLTEKVRILGNGNVGIGTTAPDKKLEINLGTSDALRLTYDDANGSATTYMDTTVSSVGLTTFTGAGSAPGFQFANSVAVGDDAAETLTISRSSANRYVLLNAIGSAAGDAFRIHNFSHPTGNTAIPDGYNIFMGAGAGNFTMGSTATNTFDASNLIGIGKNALSAVTTGRASVVIGSNAGDAITSGFDITIVGESAGGAMNTASSATAIGRSALSAATSAASSSTAIGAAALQSATTGTGQNTAVGHASLYNVTTGAENIAMGYLSGRYLADGSTANQTPSQSVYLGNLTKSSAAGQSNEIVIGYNAIGNGSNTVTLGNTSTTEGLFTSAPLKFDNINSVIAKKSATNGSIQLMSGTTVTPGAVFKLYGSTHATLANQAILEATGGLTINSAGTGNVGIGTATPYGKLDTIGTVTASANYGLLNIGPAATAFDGATAGFFAGSASGTQLAINAASGFAGNLIDAQVAGVSQFSVTNAGVVQQKGCTTAGALFADTSGNVICDPSRAEFKDNIINLNSGLSSILALRPVSYTFKSEMNMGSGTYFGFISGEVASVAPEFATYDAEGKPYGLDTKAILSTTVKAIQELDLKITEINNLEKENTWRDSIVAWLANAGNRITRIFTGEVCLTEAGQEAVCLNRAELQSLKALIVNQSGGTTPTADPAPDPTPDPAPEPAPEPTPEPTPEPQPGADQPPAETLPTEVGTPTTEVGAEPTPAPEPTI